MKPRFCDTVHQAFNWADSIADIQALFTVLNQRDAHVTACLNRRIASQDDLSRELARLDLLRAHTSTHIVGKCAISNSILPDAASNAYQLSSAVRHMDSEQSNVKAILEVIEQVADLKESILSVHCSMGVVQDWEMAAYYLNRAANIPSNIIDGSFAKEMVPTGDAPDPPRVIIENAAESLCSVFLRGFEKAARDGDDAGVTRAFKLFPLIGRSDVGLDAYSRYVCHGVSLRARANLDETAASRESTVYTNLLTKLFEHVAQIVSGHEGLVERHYGVGAMDKVIERLQVEADVHGGIILDTWRDRRNLHKKLTDIRSYAFSFLVQSFMPGPSGGTPYTFPARKDNLAAGASDDDVVSMKDVDGLLGEIATMLKKWSLYTRFLAIKTYSHTLDYPSTYRDFPLHMPDCVATSNLAKKVNDNLLESYSIMTAFVLRRSVEKAFQMDEFPPNLTLNLNRTLSSSPPFVTSAVDDVMYIVDQVLHRSLKTSQRGAVANVVTTIGRVLGSDFVGMIQRKMRDNAYLKAATQGGVPPEDNMIAFFVLLNNLDVANDYIRRVVESCISSHDQHACLNSDDHDQLVEQFPLAHDAILVETALKAMVDTFENKTTELITDGISVAFHQIVKPRMQSILAESFRDMDYALDAASLETSGQRDDRNIPLDPILTSPNAHANVTDNIVRARFENAWSALTRPVKRILTERNFHRLFVMCVSHLSKALETRIWAYYGSVNELGAVRFERDIAGIVSAVIEAGGRYTLKDTFHRCTQLTMVMTMEADEWDEVEAEADEGLMSFHWVLDRPERQRARAIVR